MPYCTVGTENEAPIKIHYEDHGSGQPVVLLHGFPDSGRLWRHQVPALTGAGYRVIVPDMRGYGRSTRPVEVDAYNIEHLVSDVGAVLADAGVPGPTWWPRLGGGGGVGAGFSGARHLTAWWPCRSGIRPRSGAARVSWISISWRRRGSCCSSSSRGGRGVAVREPMDELPESVPSSGRRRGDRQSRSEFVADLASTTSGPS